MNTNNYESAIELIRILKEHSCETRLVGGCVRDRLLGKEPKDYDLATTALPEKVLGILAGEGIKTIATGLKHGTITAILKEESFEITTLRHDLHTDGRHAQIAYADSFLEDAKRRDFTINAMYEDEKKNIYDFFDGRSDLKQKKLRFVGNPKERIKEDFLRIMRYFRFAAKLGFNMDPNVLDIIKEEKNGLKILSKERVISEMNLIFQADVIADVIRAMNGKSILKTIFSEKKDPLDEKKIIFFDTEKNSFFRWAYFGFYFDLTNWILSKKDNLKISLIHKIKDCTDEIEHIMKEPIQRSKIFDFVETHEGLHHKNTLSSEGVLDFYISYFSYFKDEHKAGLFEKLKLYLLKNNHLKKPKDLLDGHEILAISKTEDKKKISHWKKKLLHGYWDEKWQTKDEARRYLQSILDAKQKP